MNLYPQLDSAELEQIRKDREIRRSLASKSHLWFFSLYLPHYITSEFAPFHNDIFKLTEEDIAFAVLIAFRGSAKSTLVTLSYAIWSIIGIQQKKFVLIVSQTQAQAKVHLENIKRELESNLLLKDDIGPFDEPKDKWSSDSIVIPKYDARITAVSTEQSIRGIRHCQHRPDLIICDDIEDLNSIKTKEGREKTNSWWNAEIIPVGDESTKIVVVGNLLHEDSLLMRFKKRINEGKMKGKFLEIPLIDENGNIAWEAKYPNEKDIQNLRSNFFLESAYQREYLLKIISDEDRVVRAEWIKYYDSLPDESTLGYTATGIDLAISDKSSSDYTAMVSGNKYGYATDLKIYILPNPVNKRLDFPATIRTIKELSFTRGGGGPTKLWIEEVGYQLSLIQQLREENIPVEGFKPKGQDKKARLSLTTHLIQLGKILFPKHGAEELIEQLVGFGVEKHDDLVDAFSILILSIISDQSYDLQLILDINKKSISEYETLVPSNPFSEGFGY
jgi:predicted phage terminase large subunit-like protein